MSDVESSVGAFVASFNTVAATELCVRTMRRYAGRPFSLTVGDGGSTDGSLRLLREFADAGVIELEEAPSGRTHAEWLDRWFATCPHRYAVFSDSDVEYRREGWLVDLLDVAKRENAALVATRIQARDMPAYHHPVTGMRAKFAPRPEPWLMVIDIEQTRDKVHASFAYAEERTASGLVAYDTSAAFYKAVQEAGLRSVEMPASFQKSYRHYGAMSWQKATDRRLGLRRQLRQALKEVEIRARLIGVRRGGAQP